MTQTPTKLWNLNFIAYWLGIGATALGDALIFVALPFLVLELSDNPQALATAVLLGSLPRFLGPVIGLLADRLHLKLPLLGIGLARAAIFASLGLLALGDTLTLNLLYGAAFLNGLLTVFVFSAGNVLLPKLVPEQQLARANSLMQGAIMGLPLAGYGLAGVLVSSLGTALTILFAAPLFVLLGVAALIVKFPAPTPSKVNVLRDLSAGARFMLSNTVLSLAVVVGLFMNFALSALKVLIPLAMQALERGAGGYGLFEAVFAGGILVGIGTVSLIGERIKLTRQIGIGTVLLGIGFGVLSLARFEVLIAGAVMMGLGLGFTEVAAVTLLQLIVPDGMRGKVMGMLIGLNAFGLSLGAFVAGQLAERLGLGTLYLVFAALALALSLLWLVKTASFRLEPAQSKPI